MKMLSKKTTKTAAKLYRQNGIRFTESDFSKISFSCIKHFNQGHSLLTGLPSLEPAFSPLTTVLSSTPSSRIWGDANLESYV